MASEQGDVAPAQEEAGSSGLVIEKIGSGFVVAPDLKLTRIDGGGGALVGLYGGKITDRFLIGAAGYGLAGASSALQMAYGGVFVEWFRDPGGLFDVSLRGLVGGGAATVFGAYADPYDPVLLEGGGKIRETRWVRPGAEPGSDTCADVNSYVNPMGADAPMAAGRHAGSSAIAAKHGRGSYGKTDPPWGGLGCSADGMFPFRTGFVIAEPQASVYLNVAEWLRIGGAAGYRFIGAAGPAGGGRLQGATFSIGVQVGRHR